MTSCRRFSAQPESEREGICIAYLPAPAVQADIRALLDVRETSVVMQPAGDWGAIKVGAGTPPVRTNLGWLLVFHGIDVMPGDAAAERPALQYRAGIALLDIARPHVVTYRSPAPIFWPELPQERHGIVDDVVFPTAIDPRRDIGPDAYDVYYGMADALIGRGRLTVSP